MTMKPEKTITLTELCTDVGLKRSRQEDSVGFFEGGFDTDSQALAQQKGYLYVVADGLGGKRGGDIASSLAVETILEAYYANASLDVSESLKQAVEKAHKQLIKERKNLGLEEGVYTTVVCAVIRGDKLWIAHVGDSRAYGLRGKKITPLTQDHSGMRTHAVSHVLGDEDSFEVEIKVSAPLRKGDWLLLCTDGLHQRVVDEQIAKAMVVAKNPEQACKQLVMLANAMGGVDNVGLIVSEIKAVQPYVDNKPLVQVNVLEKGASRWATMALAKDNVGESKATRYGNRAFWAKVAIGVIFMLLLVWNFTLQSRVSGVEGELDEAYKRLDLVHEEINVLNDDYESGEYGVVDEKFLRRLQNIERLSNKENELPLIITIPTDVP